MPAASINCLAFVLKELGWSYTRLIAELRRHASVALPKTESMVTLVSRWVNNHQQPDDFYRDLLSRATGRARVELFGDEPVAPTGLLSGLVVARSVAGLPTTGEDPLSSGGDGLVAWLRQQEPELKEGSVERRSFLASLALLGVDLTALAPASSAQAGSVSERAVTVDGALLRDLDLTTAAYERMRHRVPGRHLMRQVVGHIELTEDVLRGSLWPTQKQRLLANLSQTTSLVSWLLFFDQGDRAAARAWLVRSTRAAQESGDPELMVLAMIRGAEQQTYSGQAHQSGQLLDAAERLAAGTSPKALSWILAANAEAHATLGELVPSLALLDRSLDALGPGRTGDDPSWAEYWNRSKVLGYMGACHMRMRRPEAARAALDDALQLGEELTVKHQSIYLVDLATTYTQEREPEEACRLASKALDIAGPMHYSTTMERMTALRRDLDTWNSEACVQQLDERLHALANAGNERP